MFQVQITNPTTRRLILEELVERMDAGHLDALLLDGADPDVLDLLRHRPARDFIHAAKLEQLEIVGSFDGAKVLRCFARLDMIKRDIELQEYFVRHGASAELAGDLFKMSMDEFRRMRSLLAPEMAVPGRVKLPPPSVRERIHEDWARLNKQVPAPSRRECLYQLHQMHGDWSIHSLWATLHEFDEKPAAARPPRPRGAPSPVSSQAQE
jgi:hypothetical protein